MLAFGPTKENADCANESRKTVALTSVEVLVTKPFFENVAF